MTGPSLAAFLLLAFSFTCISDARISTSAPSPYLPSPAPNHSPIPTRGPAPSSTPSSSSSSSSSPITCPTKGRVDFGPTIDWGFKGLSFGRKFTLRVTFEITVGLDGTVFLPCNCTLAATHIGPVGLPFEVKWDFINIYTLASFLGVPGASIYRLVRILNGAKLLYDAQRNYQGCVVGSLEKTDEPSCTLKDLVELLNSCTSLLRNFFGDENKRELSSQDDISDPSTYTGELRLYTNVTVGEVLEGVIAYQLPASEYVLINSQLSSGSHHLNFESFVSDPGYALVIPDSPMDKNLSSSYSSSVVSWAQYFDALSTTSTAPLSHRLCPHIRLQTVLHQLQGTARSLVCSQCGRR